jgi:hypothetical protein
MRGVLDRTGIKTSAASMTICTNTESSKERRRVRRARWSWSASPSTRQALKDVESGFLTGWSCDFAHTTHLHTITNLLIAEIGDAGFLISVDFRKPAPRSQGCEVRVPQFIGHREMVEVPASSLLSTVRRARGSWIDWMKSSEITEVEYFRGTVPKWEVDASHSLWTWIPRRAVPWTGVTKQ